ncbi:MAG: hypothetical protein J5J00_03990 [Deltaproteobacteria bacterium]|nr:hypothetical protein [Deltaproteobacteria bacterium]
MGLNLPVLLSGCARYRSIQNGRAADYKELQGEKLAEFISPAIVPSDLAPSDIALSVCNDMLQSRGISIKEVDLLISCTQTPDYNNPGLASLLLAKLGAEGIAGLELKMSDAAPIYACRIASAFIRTGKHKRILIAATDLMSRYFSSRENKLSRYFGDAAAAVIVGGDSESVRGKAFRYIASHAAAIGAPESFGVSSPRANQFPFRIRPEDFQDGSMQPRLQPQEFAECISKEAAAILTSFISKYLPSGRDVRWVVCHSPIGGEFLDRLALPQSLQRANLVDEIAYSGYVASAGAVCGLSRLSEQEVKSGDLICVLSAGAGINFGVMLLEAA